MSYNKRSSLLSQLSQQLIVRSVLYEKNFEIKVEPLIEILYLLDVFEKVVESSFPKKITTSSISSAHPIKKPPELKNVPTLSTMSFTRGLKPISKIIRPT